MSWNDHSDQSLCSLVNDGALPTVRVSMGGAAFGAAETCNRVRQGLFRLNQALCQHTTHLPSTELPPWLRILEYCHFIDNVLLNGFHNLLLRYHVRGFSPVVASLPRLKLHLFFRFPTRAPVTPSIPTTVITSHWSQVCMYSRCSAQ